MQNYYRAYTMLGKIAALAVVLAVQGCASVKEQLERDRRDAPWDPKQGQLFDQIPNWDGNASRVCCGHLRQCKEWQSPRC